MQKLVALAVALLCAFSLSACHTKEKYAKNNAAGQTWLSSFTRGAGITVGGSWASLEWGSANFIQNGRKVTGTLGNYSVEGVISGGKVYLLITSDGWIYYTAVLEKTSSGILAGHYSESVPFDIQDQHELLLKRW